MIFRQPFYSPSWGLGSAFEELERMRRRMDRFYDDAMPTDSAGQAGVFPPINLTEDKDKFYVRAEPSPDARHTFEVCVFVRRNFSHRTARLKHR